MRSIRKSENAKVNDLMQNPASLEAVLLRLRANIEDRDPEMPNTGEVCLAASMFDNRFAVAGFYNADLAGADGSAVFARVLSSAIKVDTLVFGYLGYTTEDETEIQELVAYEYSVGEGTVLAALRMTVRTDFRTGDVSFGEIEPMSLEEHRLMFSVTGLRTALMGHYYDPDVVKILLNICEAQNKIEAGIPEFQAIEREGYDTNELKRVCALVASLINGPSAAGEWLEIGTPEEFGSYPGCLATLVNEETGVHTTELDKETGE